jgi:hypothetical protein
LRLKTIDKYIFFRYLKSNKSKITNMKKTLLLLVSITTFASASIAQVTITATGANPVVGETFTLVNGSYVSPGNAGANQTWNLSSMSGTAGALDHIVAPSSTTYGASYPSANIAWNNFTNGVNYFKTSSSALQFYGVGSSSAVQTYSNPEDFLHYPFSMSNTYTDPFIASYVSSGYTWYRKGNVTITADGYGTLITPSGTFSNVLRVHMVETYTDSAFIGMPYVMNTSSDQYTWYRNGTHMMVANVFSINIMGNTSTGGVYLTGSVGVNENSLLSSESLYPNPASESTTLEFVLTESKKVTIKICNELGQETEICQQIQGFQGENTTQFNLNDLAEGIYFARIIVDGNLISTKRFVVSR